MAAKSFALHSLVRTKWPLSFCLGLFCLVTVSAQSTPTSNQPPAVTVLDQKWLKVRKRDTSTPTIAPPEVDEKTGLVKPPNDNTDLRRTNVEVPADVRTKALRDDDTLIYNYFYWLKVQNASPKKIRSLAYDYVFVDPGSKIELKRYSLRTFFEIATNQTKWIWSGPGQNPPQMVSVAGLKKNRRSPFDERVEIKCLLFTDGTGWRSADAKPETCAELVRITLQNNPHPDRSRIDPGNP